jgi:hypothetical protein
VIEEKLENPEGIHWRRLSAWWNAARVQIYARELPRGNEKIAIETAEQKERKAKQEEEDMQKEGLWIAKAVTHYSEKSVAQKIGEAALKNEALLATQRELGTEATPFFRTVLTALNNPGTGSPKARMEYLKKLDEIWSDTDTNEEQKIALEANWLAEETIKVMRAQAARKAK